MALLCGAQQIAAIEPSSVAGLREFERLLKLCDDVADGHGGPLAIDQPQLGKPGR